MEKPEQPYALAPRCGAKTRSGRPCMAPKIRGRKRCRMHGGASPGAPTGERNGNYKHGLYTKQAAAGRLLIKRLLAATRETMTEMV